MGNKFNFFFEFQFFLIDPTSPDPCFPWKIATLARPPWPPDERPGPESFARAGGRRALPACTDPTARPALGRPGRRLQKNATSGIRTRGPDPGRAGLGRAWQGGGGASSQGRTHGRRSKPVPLDRPWGTMGGLGQVWWTGRALVLVHLKCSRCSCCSC